MLDFANEKLLSKKIFSLEFKTYLSNYFPCIMPYRHIAVFSVFFLFFPDDFFCVRACPQIISFASGFV